MAVKEAEMNKAVDDAIQAVGNDVKLQKAVAVKVAAWRKSGGLTKAIAAGLVAVVKAIRWFISNLVRAIIFAYMWLVCPVMAILFWLFATGTDAVAAIQRKLANRKAVK